MSYQTQAESPSFGFLSGEIQDLNALAELALDLRWSWNHCTDKIWKRLDPLLWDLTHNPWIVLQTVSRDRVERVAADPDFRQMVDDLVHAKRRLAETPAWFQRSYPHSDLTCVAYLSMEFALSEALPIYSGGLGSAAGDQLKAASDLGVPVIGVGLLYQQAYFRQVIDRNGTQEALFPYNDPGQLPILPVREPNGEWLRLEIVLPGCSVWLRAWQVQVGRVKLYLLDSNDAANFPAYRGITSELYGGDTEIRLKQELLLGIGGWRLLRALGIRPEVCHMNGGHVAFAVLERARIYMDEAGQSFETALAITRAGNLFTTHATTITECDRFAPSLIKQYLGDYAEKKLGIALHELMALGRQDPHDSAEAFNMTYLAIRGSGAVNGVSRLQGKVSRRIFQPLFPRWPVDEVPVGHVTNGVHVPSWDSAYADDLWTEACGGNRWLDATECLEQGIRQTPDAKLWKMRTHARTALIDYVREKYARQLMAAGAPPHELKRAKHLFDSNTLTLGFAHCFVTCERPNLLLRDRDRLFRLLTNPQRPIQLIIAGKAQPDDQAGRALIQEWIQFLRSPEISPHGIFLSDYDMFLVEQLMQGVDVSISTPRVPCEVNGTSGMEVLVNGGINLSELDGWWAEAYTPGAGWALGDGQEHRDDAAWDNTEAHALYDLLEYQVIPEFYARDENDIPTAWVARSRESMSRLTPQYSANRMVREYTEKHYLRAAAAFRMRTNNNQDSVGNQLIRWMHSLKQNWKGAHFGKVKIETNGAWHQFEAQVYLGCLDPSAIRIELYADADDGGSPVQYEMTLDRQLPDPTGGYAYRTQVPATRPATNYTVRMVPHFPGASVPLEDSHILWEH